MQGTAFRSSSIFAPLRSLITHRSQQTAMLSCRAAKVSACVPKPAESAFHVTTPSGERAWVHSSTGERTNSLPTHSHQTQRRGVFPRPRRPRLPGRPYRRRVCRRPHRRCRYDTCCFLRRSPTQSHSHSHSHSHSLASIRPRLAQGMYHIWCLNWLDDAIRPLYHDSSPNHSPGSRRILAQSRLREQRRGALPRQVDQDLRRVPQWQAKRGSDGRTRAGRVQ